MEQDATSYMPTSLDLEKLMPRDSSQAQEPSVDAEPRSENRRPPTKSRTREERQIRVQADVNVASVKRKRISLYLDDEVLTKIFHVSLERHEQLSSATHTLILEALKARGL
ncbi:hypothetical protein FHX15_004979 [Rhizobium sp. BK650]|uniref:hypothetical protein n=1 Tax=Rhizobium sp. BK650 TaxID=2586990 RepID=UPI00179B39BD|nr:hypothetical protein [Rhizobium sp. BK650]MBB3659711.1 hypothetical protein [Rhizobium sp. BK650]